MNKNSEIGSSNNPKKLVGGNGWLDTNMNFSAE
jgi:hypothetical protein